MSLWDINSGRELTIFKKYKGHISSIVFSSDSKKLAATIGNIIRLWDIENGKELTVFKGHKGYFRRRKVMAYPDGRILVATAGGTIRLRDIQTGKELTVFKGHIDGVDNLVFSPDGKTMASLSGADGALVVWEVQTGKAKSLMRPGHISHVTSMSLSPDGKTLASSSWTIRIRDIKTRKELSAFRHKGFTNFYDRVVFSPDGKILASASNTDVRLWDVETGKEIAIFEYDGDFERFIFSPDGKTLVAGSRLLDLRPYILFWQGNKPTPLYRSFIQGVKFLWQVELDGFEFTSTYTPTLYAQDGYNFVYDTKFRPLLNPPSPGQSKFDQVLEWAEQQQNTKK